MQFLPTTVPTSSEVGFLPMALNSLENVFREMHAEETGPTTKQQIVAHAIATVFVTVAAAFDAVIVHPVLFVVKCPGVVVKALAGLVSELDEDMPEAFDAQDWLGHVRKVYTCVVSAVNGVLLGVCDPESVLVLGRRFHQMTQNRIVREESLIEDPTEV